MTVSRDHYYRLASEVPQERIESATSLLSELQETDTKEEWDYALNRLIKGLNSTRQSAKIGFSMSLIEVITVLIRDDKYDLSVLSYLTKLMELTEIKSSMKGKEERAILFGRLFGLQALLNSGLLYDDDVSLSKEVKEFANILIDLSIIKSWLRESTIFTLYTFVNQFISVSENSNDFLKFVFQKLNDSSLNLTTEGMAIYLAIPKNLRPTVVLNVSSNNHTNWKNGDPLYRDNLNLLTKVLKDAEVVEEPTDEDSKQKPKQKSNWSPRTHFVWDLIIKEFLQNNDVEDEEVGKKRKKHSKEGKSKKSKKSKTSGEDESESISLKLFWKVVVDESLFSEKASHERKYWGFELFTKFLKSAIPDDEIQNLFTPNLIRCLINQSSQQNRFLNKISIQVLKTIVTVSKVELSKAPIILECLLNESHGGCWNFDLVTKSKTVDEILSSSEVENVVKQFKNILIKKFSIAQENADNEVKEEKESDDNEEGADVGEEEALPMKLPLDNVQKWCLDKLLHLTRTHKNLLQNPEQSSLLKDIFKLFIKIAYFKVVDGKNISNNVKNIAQERLNSILSDIINFKNDDNEPWPLFCIDYIRELENDDNYELLSSFDESLIEKKDEILEILSKIKKSIKKSKKKGSKGDEDQLYCFQLLFSMVLIQFYMADEEAVSVLEELKMCYEDITQSSKADDDEEIDSAQILTEIILSFVARKSTLLKKLSMIIWDSFLCAKNDDGKLRLNETSLQLLYDVLVARENKEGLEKVFEGQGEYEAEDEEENDEDGEEDEDEDSDNSDDDDDSESETDPDSTVDRVEKETSEKLAEALGIPSSSGEVKFEDISSGDDDDYESDSMDDEQMMEIDDQLSKIFKERRNALSTVVSGNARKNEVMEAKEQMIFFKNRILDLLESLNKHQPSSYLNLTMIKPIVILIGLTLDKNVGLKAHKLLKTKISKTKISALSESENGEEFKESLLETIQWLHQTATSSSSNQSHSLACNQACIILSKNLIGLDESYLDQVIEIYTQSLKDWAVNKKSKIQASMFFDFINWLNAKREHK